MIEVSDLSVTFRVGRQPIHAVRGASFVVAEGETFGIVGESGSGKSTVLKAIAGLVPTAAPSLRINGQPLGTKRSKADRRLMQFVFQDPYGSLHPRQTVDDILRAQADADATYFVASCGRPFGMRQQLQVVDVLRRAYRWQYIASGARHPRFARVLKELSTPAQHRRLKAALESIVPVS